MKRLKNLNLGSGHRKSPYPLVTAAAKISDFITSSLQHELPNSDKRTLKPAYSGLSIKRRDEKVFHPTFYFSLPLFIF